MSGAARHARVPAELGRDGWARTAGHTATAGTATGRGASMGAALDDLGAVLAAMASRAHDEPSFWWDAANGQLHVAVPSPVDGGHTSYIVRMGDAGPSLSQCTSSGSAPACDALASAVGVTRVERERR